MNAHARRAPLGHSKSHRHTLEHLAITKRKTKNRFLSFSQIHALEFDPNGEITALVSNEKEVVPLTKKINPNAANVMCSIIIIIIIIIT